MLFDILSYFDIGNEHRIEIWKVLCLLIVILFIISFVILVQ